MTLVTLAMGRSALRSRLHSTWPVAASASTAPLALTFLGAPATWIRGEMDGLGVAGVADGRGVAVVASRAAGLAWPPAVAAEQAVRLPAVAAAAISETIRVLLRIPVSASTGHRAVVSVTGQRDQIPATRARSSLVASSLPGAAV